MDSVAVFTDTYLPTVNGVTYTIQTWRDRWQARGGRMDVVYPGADEYDPETGEHPVRSLPFPFYDGFRLGLPRVPRSVRDADVVHAHTPFALGLAGARLAWRSDRPLVASYHTPTSEYAAYLTTRDSAAGAIERLSEGYERWFYGRTDAVLVPSEDTRDHLVDHVGVPGRVEVVPNGVDVAQFRPVHPESFRRKYDLGDGPLLGYTGRHGYEKRLVDVLDAVAGLDRDVTVVFGGDGPARADLEATARELGVDAHFLGFLDREELPDFYSALDVFTFPSPVETQGLVALEANACGTPVVGVDSGALSNTIDDGETGFHYREGDIDGFRDGIVRALDERDRLRETCLERREEMSVENAVDRLSEIYASVA
jgi:glycosyltransferase involved in cell wall biosynthesis